jgi:hypothetical protein
MNIEVERDAEGLLATVRGRDSLNAFGFSKEDALKELGNVVGMMMDYQQRKAAT